MGYAENLNKISNFYREKWGDNAVEAVVGLLSTVISESQLEALVKNLEEQSERESK